MAITIKNTEEIEKMRVAGRLAAQVLEMIEPYVKPGISTDELIASLREQRAQYYTENYTAEDDE